MHRCMARKTSTRTKYVRSELREMLRRGNTHVPTQGVTANNWVFSSAPQRDREAAGAVDGVMDAELAINHVTTTGKKYQLGRVVIGQIHANRTEPIRLYYQKLPDHQTGSIYFAHDVVNGPTQWYDMIGRKSFTKKQSEPEDGIALNERFGYRIEVRGNTLTVTLHRHGKKDVVKTVDMSRSGYDQGGNLCISKRGFITKIIQRNRMIMSRQHFTGLMLGIDWYNNMIICNQSGR
ncbi:polysaccharide lyase family 7 protein [Vibrio sp. PP-XX7]